MPDSLKWGVFANGKHELMSTKGHHYSMLMQMARRGGRKASRRIEQGEIDGYIQALRGSALEEEKSKKQPPIKRERERAPIVGTQEESWGKWPDKELCKY